MSELALKLIEKEKSERTGTLSIVGLNLINIPIEITELKHLQELQLDFNRLSNLNHLLHLTNLKRLTLSYNRISDLSFLKDLSKLEILNLNRNKIKTIQSVVQLDQLKSLDLRSNNINSIAPLLNLKELNTLLLSNNRIDRFDILEEMVQLKILGISKSNIDKIIFLKNLLKLEYLDLSSNNIKNLEPLKGLLRLTTLLLNSNNITNITPILPIIKNNPVKVTLYNFQRKYQINLNDNPLKTPPLEVVKQGSGTIKKYFDELETQGTVELYEAKLLIIGQGGVGKTSLMTKLLDETAELPKEEETTKGIDVQEYHFKTKTDKDFRINIWDFGGQEIYHSTHQIFLTKRSLYVLVDDTRKNDKTANDSRFNYWLETVRLFGGESPIVIVQNEKGDRSKALDLKNIQSRFSNVKEVFPTNLLTCRNLDKTKTALEYYIQNLPIVGQKLPKQWVKIRTALEEMEKAGTHYLTLKEYFKVCGEHKIPEEDRALILSQYLHDLGVFLHFQQDRVLNKTVILHNEWATDAVYKVLDCESVKVAKGRFTWDDLQEIWGDKDCREKYANMHGELLALMKNFELCYELESEKDTFLAPQLFEESQPDYDWDIANNLILRYEYGFMPKGLISRIIVRMHQYVKDLEKAWKNGVVLQRGNTEAEIVSLYAEQEIRIRVRGRENKAFLEVIIHEFDKLHGEFEGIRVDKKIPCICNRCQSEDWKGKYYFPMDFLKIAYQQNRSVQCQKSADLVDVYRLISDTLTIKRMEDFRELSREIGEMKRQIKSTVSKQGSKQPIDAEDLKELIGLNEIGDVFDVLLAKCGSGKLKNSIVLLKSRWQINKENRRNGIVSMAEFKLESNNINNALLEWISEW